MCNHNYQSYEYLVNNNLFLVYLLAQRFEVSLASKEKLIDVGFLALIEAIKTFDMFTNDNFKTYAINIILLKMRKKYNELCLEEVKC